MDQKVAATLGLDQRSREIFRRLVENYLETGEPVGSRTISRSLPMNLSPASVRNVMADLEESGLLFSPHTSAGRIPTHHGLRFFVDALLERGKLSEQEQMEIDRQIASLNREQRLEDVLGDATTLLSGLSHCTGVVVTPKANVRVRHVEFVQLAQNRGLVILVSEDGSVENRAIDLPAGVPVSTLTRVSNYLNARFQGQSIPEIQRAIAEELETLRRELDEVGARVVEAGLAIWSEDNHADGKTLIVRGRAHLIENTTAQEDLERMRQLFDDLEAKKELIGLLGLAQSGEGVRIFIGAESNLFSLSGSSLVVSPYHDAEQNIVGVLGVIGPTRLNYARIIPIVDYTARMIGRLLT